MRRSSKKTRHFRELDDLLRPIQLAGCVVTVWASTLSGSILFAARCSVGGLRHRLAFWDQPRPAAAAARGISVFSFGGVGMMVIVQRGGSLASISCTARTSPVTVAADAAVLHRLDGVGDLHQLAHGCFGIGIGSTDFIV